MQKKTVSQLHVRVIVLFDKMCCFRSSFPDMGVVSWQISRRKLMLFPVTKILLASLLENGKDRCSNHDFRQLNIFSSKNKTHLDIKHGNMDVRTRYFKLHKRSIPTSGKISTKNSENGSSISPSSNHLLSICFSGRHVASSRSLTRDVTIGSPLCRKLESIVAKSPPFFSWHASQIVFSHCSRCIGSTIQSITFISVICSAESYCLLRLS